MYIQHTKHNMKQCISETIIIRFPNKRQAIWKFITIFLVCLLNVSIFFSLFFSISIYSRPTRINLNYFFWESYIQKMFIKISLRFCSNLKIFELRFCHRMFGSLLVMHSDVFKRQCGKILCNLQILTVILFV